MLRNKILAWAAFALVIVLLCITFTFRTTWWSFIDIFFAFMMTFLHLMSAYITPKLPTMGRQLDTAAFFMGCGFVIALIAEFVAFQYI